MSCGGTTLTVAADLSPNVLIVVISDEWAVPAMVRNILGDLAKMASGLPPVIDTQVAPVDFEHCLAWPETQQVFGKINVIF